MSTMRISPPLMPLTQKMFTCSSAKPVDKAVTRTTPSSAPQTVTVLRREKAAPIKVASTISSSSGSSEPGELPEPRASSVTAATVAAAATR